MKLQFRVFSVLAVSGPLLAAVPGRASARAPKGESACVAAFRGAQESEQEGKLAEARQLWLKCARATCGSFLKQNCTSRYTQLDADIPSIVPVATDETGGPLVDVQVRMDGQLIASQLDGRALPLDPGLHEFSFSADGNVFFKQKVMIAQGQRNRQISASIRPPGKHAPAQVAASKLEREPMPRSEAKSEDRAGERAERAVVKPLRTLAVQAKKEDDGGSPATTLTRSDEPAGESHALSYVLGGTGLASIGAGALMIYWGRKDNDLLGQCSPTCPPSRLDHIRRLYLGGDIAVGAGVTSLLASFLVYKLSGPTKEEGGTEEAYRLHVVPTSSGAVASVSGTF